MRTVATVILRIFALVVCVLCWLVVSDHFPPGVFAYHTGWHVVKFGIGGVVTGYIALFAYEEA